MKIGVAMAFNHYTRPERIIEASQAVEAAGFHSIWAPEHVVFFSAYESAYPYSANGRIPGEPEGLLDPFTALTYVAAHTKTLRLGTGVCLVPQRQPIYTAKMVADLDYLSGGRVDFGVGAGWLEEEFRALGVPFERRGARTADAIRAMKALWAPGEATYAGEFYGFDACHFNPKPVQTPHPPIFFGGESRAALRRVAQLGDGWYGYDLDPAGVAQRLSELDGLLAEAGRSRDDITVYVGPNSHPVTPDTVAQYRDLGVEQLVVPMAASNSDKLKTRMERILSVVR